MPPVRLLLLRHSSASTTRWNPSIAFSAAIDRLRARKLTAEDTHHLFDQLMQHDAPVPELTLNGFLATLSRAPPSNACREGVSHVVALFNCMCQGAGPWVAPSIVCTYAILMNACCRERRISLVFSFFGRLIRTCLVVNVITITTLLKALCCLKQTDEAADVLLHRMPEIGCTPDVVSYNTIINGFFKEGQVDKACSLYHEMVQRGVPPDVVTYSSVIDTLCKARAMETAQVILRQMVGNGVRPGCFIYNSLIYGFSSSGRWKEGIRVFKDMPNRDVVTCNSLMTSLCKYRRTKEAREIFDSMEVKDPKPDIVSYSVLLHGYATEGCLVEMTNLFNSMAGAGIQSNCHVFNILMDEAMLIFEEMCKQGVSPNVVTYSTVIASYCKMGKLDSAMDKFNRMIDMAVQSDIVSYHCLIQGFCIHGDLARVKELVTEMMNRGFCPPDVMFFNLVINNLWKEGKVTQVM